MDKNLPISEVLHVHESSGSCTIHKSHYFGLSGHDINLKIVNLTTKTLFLPIHLGKSGLVGSNLRLPAENDWSMFATFSLCKMDSSDYTTCPRSRLV